VHATRPCGASILLCWSFCTDGQDQASRYLQSDECPITYHRREIRVRYARTKTSADTVLRRNITRRYKVADYESMYCIRLTNGTLKVSSRCLSRPPPHSVPYNPHALSRSHPREPKKKAKAGERKWKHAVSIVVDSRDNRREDTKHNWCVEGMGVDRGRTRGVMLPPLLPPPLLSTLHLIPRRRAVVAVSRLLCHSISFSYTPEGTSTGDRSQVELGSEAWEGAATSREDAQPLQGRCIKCASTSEEYLDTEAFERTSVPVPSSIIFAVIPLIYTERPSSKPQDSAELPCIRQVYLSSIGTSTARRSGDCVLPLIYVFTLAVLPDPAQTNVLTSLCVQPRADKVGLGGLLGNASRSSSTPPFLLLSH